MIVGTAGYGSVGASAVVDFLRGYDGMQTIPFEFQLIHQPDGIFDLKYYLTQNRGRISCNSAIKRFKILMYQSTYGRCLKKLVGKDYNKIVQAYLEDIIQIKWIGKSGFDPLDISKLPHSSFMFFLYRGINRILHQINSNWDAQICRERYFSLLDEDYFDFRTKKFLLELLKEAEIDLNKNILLDMGFSATNPMLGTEFFDDIKIIVIDRDPRDNYVAAKLDSNINNFMPHDTIEKFVHYFKLSRSKTKWNDKILRIQYEDLIYHYQETTQMIMDYLGLKERPQNEFAYFDPDVSVKYTKLYEKYPKYNHDIEYIESNLKEYLYNFQPYTFVKRTSEK